VGERHDVRVDGVPANRRRVDMKTRISNPVGATDVAHVRIRVLALS